SLLVSSFFFQAEDGIRDFHVTGVQTCALPISASPFSFAGSAPVHTVRFLLALAAPRVPSLENYGNVATIRGQVRCGGEQKVSRRSEERRVGKECRARWAP